MNGVVWTEAHVSWIEADDHCHQIEFAECEPDDALGPAELLNRMQGAFRRARSLTLSELEVLRSRYRVWRNDRLAPFVSVLADAVLRSLGVNA